MIQLPTATALSNYFGSVGSRPTGVVEMASLFANGCNEGKIRRS